MNPKNKEPQRKTVTPKIIKKASAPEVKAFIEKAYLYKLFTIKSDDKKAYSTFIALDKRNGKALKVIEHHIAYNNSFKYEVQDITYDDVRKFDREKNIEDKGVLKINTTGKNVLSLAESMLKMYASNT